MNSLRWICDTTSKIFDKNPTEESYNNVISVFEEEKVLKKQIMSIVTDSKELEEPKDPNNCNIFQFIHITRLPI